MVAEDNDAFMLNTCSRCSLVPLGAVISLWTNYLGRLQVYLEHSLLGAYLTV